jgi:hypothetical protein
MVCCTPFVAKLIGSILDFLWLGVKLAIWLPTLLLAIICVLDVQMSNASPFQTSRFEKIFNDIKKARSHCVLTPEIALWSFESPSGLDLPKWELHWECEGSLPHTPCTSYTPRSMWCDSRASSCLDSQASSCLDYRASSCFDSRASSWPATL